MSYFITGGTGFIGRHLVERLLARSGKIHVLVRKGSEAKFEELQARTAAPKGRLVKVTGDLAKPRLGLTPAAIAALRGKVKHFFHLAAIYDLTTDADTQQDINVGGTQRALELAAALNAGTFHHVSSIAAAGLYPGVFKEDMFSEAEGLEDPYFRTKHDSEGLVRAQRKIPYRIYRPAIVVGDSRTGEIDKIDGPYYFFRLIKKTRELLPQWMPTIGIEGSRINIVPVDFVAAAIDHIGHKRGLDGHTFHLTDPAPQRVGEVLNTFARAAHAPEMTMRVDARMFAFVPPAIRGVVGNLPPVKRFTHMVMKDLGIPREVLKYISSPTRFDTREAERALKGSGISVPPLETYAWRLWDYWERPKSALDAFAHCAQGEFSDLGIAFTTINMPLVRTAMIGPTKMYDSVPTLSPEEAADMIVAAIIKRPSRIATRLGVFSAVLNAVAPKAYEVVMNTAYNLFPDSAAAKGMKGRDEKPSNEQVAFAALMRGVHW